jgi:uncharacterized membrane protein
MSNNHNIQRDHESNRPYWKRAHRDWRFWAGVVLMLAAIAMYVMSENESLRFGKHSQQPQSDVSGK